MKIFMRHFDSIFINIHFIVVTTLNRSVQYVNINRKLLRLQKGHNFTILYKTIHNNIIS